MIVGLHGRGRAGNLDAARYLVEYHGFARYSFADTLRQLLLSVNPIMPAGGERLHDLVNEHGWPNLTNHQVIGPHLRRMLNDIGASSRVLFGQDILLNRFERWMEDEFGFSRSTARVVVCDVNLDSEALWLRDRGAKIVQILHTEPISTGRDVTDQGIHQRMIHHDITTKPSDTGPAIGAAVARVLRLEPELTAQANLRSVPLQEEIS